MHLVCINHVPTIIRHWCTQMDQACIKSIDERLMGLELPHNLRVAYYESIGNSSQWKARAHRVFALNVGVPIVIKSVPTLMLSHFLIYSMAIKILHAPESNDEISLAEKMIEYYCRTASFVYGASIELFSLHAHLHLPEQVRRHGGLVHSSAFAFESCLRFIERKAHGSKNLASQIAYWIDLQLLSNVKQFTLPEPKLFNVSTVI
jgi:hypothetical protein